MSLFDRFRRKGRSAPSGASPSGKTLAELKDFVATREGVEGYIEPQTSVYAMTLLLVAADGESVRRAVKDAKQAKELCAQQGVPLYDARIIRPPKKRMEEYQQGIRQRGISLEDLPPLETTSEPDRRPESHDE